MQLAPALDDDSAASARVAWLKAQGTPLHPPLQPRPLSRAGRSHAACPGPNRHEDPLPLEQQVRCGAPDGLADTLSPFVPLGAAPLQPAPEPLLATGSDRCTAVFLRASTYRVLLYTQGTCAHLGRGARASPSLRGSADQRPEDNLHPLPCVPISRPWFTPPCHRTSPRPNTLHEYARPCVGSLSAP